MTNKTNPKHLFSSPLQSNFSHPSICQIPGQLETENNASGKQESSDFRNKILAFPLGLSGWLSKTKWAAEQDYLLLIRKEIKLMVKQAGCLYSLACLQNYFLKISEDLTSWELDQFILLFKTCAFDLEMWFRKAFRNC
jgi:hypothetical protein